MGDGPRSSLSCLALLSEECGCWPHGWPRRPRTHQCSRFRDDQWDVWRCRAHPWDRRPGCDTCVFLPTFQWIPRWLWRWVKVRNTPKTHILFIKLNWLWIHPYLSPSSSLISFVLKLVWQPAPFQFPGIGLGSKDTTTPKSSQTLWRMKRAIHRWSPMLIPSQGPIWNSH